MSETKELVEFVRKNVKRFKNGIVVRPREVVGVLYAGPQSNPYHIGWSKTNTLMGDKFNKDKGVKIAFGRSFGSVEKLPPVALSMRKKVRSFEKRCKKYYKGMELQTVLALKTPPLM